SRQCLSGLFCNWRLLAEKTVKATRPLGTCYGGTPPSLSGLHQQSCIIQVSTPHLRGNLAFSCAVHPGCWSLKVLSRLTKTIRIALCA
ncbi:hypothetical protein, partial [Pseudomonas amygdali]|uniref:hypothetical protein n=1 Tax=Pseudomonas amygdali TaxID=47877 RepID=UPI00217F37D8